MVRPGVRGDHSFDTYLTYVVKFVCPFRVILDTLQVDMFPQFSSNMVQSLEFGMASRVKWVALMLFHKKLWLMTNIEDDEYLGYI